MQYSLITKDNSDSQILLLVWFDKSGCTMGSEELEDTGCSQRRAKSLSTEVEFTSFPSVQSTTMAIVNQPDRKLLNPNSVQCDINSNHNTGQMRTAL